MEKKTQYSYFGDDSICRGIFDSIDEAIEAAKAEWNDVDIDDAETLYERRTESPFVKIGVIEYFNIESAVESLADTIEDSMYSILDDFRFGCDIETECYVPFSQRDEYLKATKQALLPIIEKYYFFNPAYVCRPIGEYDLNKGEWINKWVE